MEYILNTKDVNTNLVKVQNSIDEMFTKARKENPLITHQLIQNLYYTRREAKEVIEGECNLTLKDLVKLAQYCGYNMEIIFTSKCSTY